MEIDESKAVTAVGALLTALGQDVDQPGLRDTPKRVAKAYRELLAGYKHDPAHILKTDFPGEGYDQMVALRDIDFYSLCEHHLIPFYGTATIAYVPNGDKVVGLSKLARLVDCFARRLQIQERMTKQITEALVKHLDPKGVGVVVKAKHLCMCARGVGKFNAEMVTSDLTGFMKDDGKARDEFLRLAGI